VPRLADVHLGMPLQEDLLHWATGKSEKCILCYPRLESGHAPACFHACVGRIRYLGVLLYDAARIRDSASVADRDLVEAQRAIVQDPRDPAVAASARANGVSDALLDAARTSPVYRFVKEWKLALPLHPEFRTLPMLFYVPPQLPVLASVREGRYEVDGAAGAAPIFSALERARVPLRFMASLFAAGNEEVVAAVYRKLIAVRVFMRARRVGDLPESEVRAALARGETTAEEAEAIFRLTSMPTFEERFVLPPLSREVAVEQTQEPDARKAEAGFGFRLPAERRW
jgi:nitrate reductase beta subunit